MNWDIDSFCPGLLSNLIGWDIEEHSVYLENGHLGWEHTTAPSTLPDLVTQELQPRPGVTETRMWVPAGICL